MRLYRGQNHNVDSFQIGEGSSNLMSELGPGKYFFNHKHRNRAIVYSLDNEVYLNEDYDGDEPEQLSEGYFYQCSIAQKEERTLDKISPSEINDIEGIIGDLLDNLDYDIGFLDNYSGKDTEEQYQNFIDVLGEQESVYHVIRQIHEELKPDCNKRFCELLIPELAKLDSFVAIANEKAGEIIVYDPTRVKIDRVLTVTPDDLEKTKEERFKLAQEAQYD